jgi:phosphopantothenoylcysteine decarboxylase/phosphopantothenate--cysteine ligase
MAAAVGDYQPIHYSKQKLKKKDKLLVFKFKKTIDILTEIGRNKGNKVLVGFAAETEKLNKMALKKLKEKNLDIIVANEIGVPGSGFQSDSNKVTIFTKDNKKVELPLMSKTNLASRILDMIEPYCIPFLTMKRKVHRNK